MNNPLLHIFRMEGESGKEKMKKWSTYAHVIPWIVPFIFCCIVIFNAKVDGYKLSGFCHVSMYSRSTDEDFGHKLDPIWITLLVFIPQCLYIILYGILVSLFCWKLNKTIPKSDSSKAPCKIKRTMKIKGKKIN